jgi:DNA topoisomerase-1
MGDVLETVAKTLEKNMFPTEETRICPDCKTGHLSLRVGRFGAFIGCSNYPKCGYTKQFATIDVQRDENGQPIEENISEKQVFELGKNENGLDISVRKGPYGWYVQMGTGKDTKRTSLPKGTMPEDIDFNKALALLSLPRTLGKNPKSDEIIEAGIGKFGPYVKEGKNYKSLEPIDDILTIGLERALELLSQKSEKSKVTKLGQWNKEDVTYQIGRYGPYVKCGKIMASVKNKEKIPTLEEGIALLQEKMHQK